MRIYELSRDLGITSKNVLDRLKKLGYEVNTASSVVPDSAEAALRASLAEARPSTVAQVGLVRDKPNAGVDALRQALGHLSRALDQDPNANRLTPAEAKALVGILGELGFKLADWIGELSVDDRQRAYTASRSLPAADELRAAARSLGRAANRWR